MDILLTGATGLIGHNLIRRLPSTHQISVLTRKHLSLEFPTNVHPIDQNLARELDFARFPKKVDAVIHLAQSRRFREFPESLDNIFSINTHATVRLAEFARRAGAKCFIFASTGGIYAPGREMLKETDPVDPPNFYTSTKYAAEILLSAFTQFFRVVVLRFFFVYGPRQKNMLIPDLLTKVIESKPILIEGNPGLRINPIYVDDAANIFTPILLSSFKGVLNVAGDEILSMTDLVNLMAEISGKVPNISYVDTQNNNDLVADNKRMKDVLGMHPQISLRQGLSGMLNFSSR
jgi:nucleoside-diphosphate-sugar epimerase